MDLATGKAHAFLNDDPSFEFVTGLSLRAAHTSKPKTAVVSTLSYDYGGERQESNTHIKRDRAMSAWIDTVYEVDTQTGKGRKVAFGTPFTVAWVLDADGEIVARSEWQAQTHQFTILVKRGLGWDSIYQRDDEHPLPTSRKFTICSMRSRIGRIWSAKRTLRSRTRSWARSLPLHMPRATDRRFRHI